MMSLTLRDCIVCRPGVYFGEYLDLGVFQIHNKHKLIIGRHPPTLFWELMFLIKAC